MRELVDTITQKALTRVGTLLSGKWRLERLLGVGGMAAVYAATHRNGNRVAVKMLHPQASLDHETTQRFLREGYLANAVGHRGVVHVLDDDVADDGSVFLVMELLEGESLDARWERQGRHLEPADVLALADQLLDVLAAAHDASIVHRDIKPDNIFLTHEGIVKVLDFGIARVCDVPEKPTTGAGVALGTPAFMSPEQALGHADEVDALSDLWSVGATMFTLLSGQMVHEGETGNEQLISAATQPVPSIRTHLPELPECVVRVVDRALSFERAARWPSARAMQSAVHRARETLGVTSSIEPPSVSKAAGPDSSGRGAMSSDAYLWTTARHSSIVPESPLARRSKRRGWLIALGAVPVVLMALWGISRGRYRAPGLAAEPVVSASAFSMPMPVESSEVPLVNPSSLPVVEAAPSARAPSSASNGPASVRTGRGAAKPAVSVDNWLDRQY